ncbi:MAG: metal-dependent hydrolase [DPANN group archaeon]|nr:metal-dependent hydrolase [DPANN group archaeon]
MPFQKVHKFFGFLVFLIYAAFAVVFLPDPPMLDLLLLLAIGLFFIIVGSVLPDIDTKKSWIFKQLKFFLAGAVFVVSFFILSGNNALGVSILVSSALSLLFIMFIGLFLPRHRGVVHRLKTGVVYGLLSMGLTYIVLGSVELSAIIGAFASLGYFSHLLLDFVDI